eukprot:30416-Ditylum_brightwellii.AAC.1
MVLSVGNNENEEMNLDKNFSISEEDDIAPGITDSTKSEHPTLLGITDDTKPEHPTSKKHMREHTGLERNDGYNKQDHFNTYKNTNTPRV